MLNQKIADKVGFVYILTSKNSDCIKIGGSDYPPIKRIKEINTTEPYKSLGEWQLADFRQVTDWRKVEYFLHYQFRSQLNKVVTNQKELFFLPIKTASDALNALDETLIVKKPKVDRMFNDEDFRNYLSTLMAWSGLNHWLNYQGAWTLVLFPATAGGRYFTLSIGSHEVAYSTLNKKSQPSIHMILLDKLILDEEFTPVHQWIKSHHGVFSENNYISASARAVNVEFEGNFNDCQTFLSLKGVRLALIAYWHDALFRLKDNKSVSVYARHHNYNAVAKLNSFLDE